MHSRPARPDAVAHIQGGPMAPHLRGTVQFFQKPGYVLVTTRIAGLPRLNPTGFYGLHIHSGKSCGGDDFTDTAGHFDPAGVPHPEHAGDLPPLLLCGTEAFLAVHTNRFRVSDILGRTVVIHSGPDDFHSQPAGNAGTKIACGVIRKG